MLLLSGFARCCRASDYLAVSMRHDVPRAWINVAEYLPTLLIVFTYESARCYRVSDSLAIAMRYNVPRSLFDA